MSSPAPENGAPRPGGERKSILPIIVRAVLIVAGIVIVIFALSTINGSDSGPEAEQSVAAPEVPEENSEPAAPYYRTDVLFVTDVREAYQSGDMTLSVPRLDFEGPVWSDVTLDSLAKGVGLYDYSPLPGPMSVNANVSIAGHRDLGGYEFYYIDTIQEGDLLYLTYENKLYTYEYEKTWVIEPDDWSVIYCTDYSCLTLTSCTPIGIADKRIVVRAKLVNIENLQQG